MTLALVKFLCLDGLVAVNHGTPKPKAHQSIHVMLVPPPNGHILLALAVHDVVHLTTNAKLISIFHFSILLPQPGKK